MRTVPGSGAILSPTFNSEYGVSSIDVIDGGSGYATTDPPKITINNTQSPIEGGIFYPIIESGEISSIVIIDPGVGYYPISSSVTATGIAFLNSSGSVSDIKITNAGYGYTQPPTITISAGSTVSSGNFIFGENVTSSITNITGIVQNWDPTTRELKISGIGSDFVVGEIITGETSNSTYIISNYQSPTSSTKYDDNENIENEADQIIDFSESNPFGDV
jgi:hypothetical protein